MLKIAFHVLSWVGTWLYFVCLVCFFGALAGVLTHLLYGLFFGQGPDFAYYASFGFLNGLKYGSVWAGGAAIVLCVIRARREYLSRQAPVVTEGAVER
jgi:hypothetical protein